MLSCVGCLYHRTCPLLNIGFTPSISTNLSGSISVSSYIINSHSCSRLNLSSPILPRSSVAQTASLSGCLSHIANNGLNPLTPSSCSLPWSSNNLFAWPQIVAKVSSSLLGVLVIIHLPPVASVGDNAVQNSLAILGGTKANSSKYTKVSDIPLPVFSVVVLATILLPLSKLMLPLLYSVTPALIWSGTLSYA